jgi:integrative and conjugative element protein (TIGR02256 family)
VKLPIFRTSDGGKFETSRYALTRMLAFVQDTPRKKEAGGVLLGRHILESLDIVVDEVTVPMHGDRRGRIRFYRDYHRHQQTIHRAWHESRGTCTYLGEWHTHPESHPTPSGTDLREWQRKLQADVFDGDRLYFIVVGTATLRIWEGVKTTLECMRIGEYFHSGVSCVQDNNPC